VDRILNAAPARGVIRAPVPELHHQRFRLQGLRLWVDRPVLGVEIPWKTRRGRTGDPVVGMQARLWVARKSGKQGGYGTHNREFVDGRLSRPRTVVMALVQ
jgi:hypothetical protein